MLYTWGLYTRGFTHGVSGQGRNASNLHGWAKSSTWLFYSVVALLPKQSLPLKTKVVNCSPLLSLKGLSKSLGWSFPSIADWKQTPLNKILRSQNSHSWEEASRRVPFYWQCALWTWVVAFTQHHCPEQLQSANTVSVRARHEQVSGVRLLLCHSESKRKCASWATSLLCYDYKRSLKPSLVHFQLLFSVRRLTQFLSVHVLAN